MTVDPKDIKHWIEKVIDCDHLSVTGDGVHFEAIVISTAFEGLTRVQRHQLVFSALGAHMESAIHAISMKTMTPSEWHG